MDQPTYISVAALSRRWRVAHNTVKSMARRGQLRYITIGEKGIWRIELASAMELDPTILAV